jgi:hypothetical protein
LFFSFLIFLEKGGFRGKFDENVKNSVKVTRYQSSGTHMTYEEWQEWKKNK